MSNDPSGEFCLLFAEPQNVTQQCPAPGQQDNNTWDLMECEQRAEKVARGRQRGRGDLHVTKRKTVNREEKKKLHACIECSAARTSILTYSMNDEGKAVSRSVHLIGFNDVPAKPSILLTGLMRAGPGGLCTQALQEQLGKNRSSEVLL